MPRVPYFGRSANPISTRGADYATALLLPPPWIIRPFYGPEHGFLRAAKPKQAAQCTVVSALAHTKERILLPVHTQWTFLSNIVQK